MNQTIKNINYSSNITTSTLSSTSAQPIGFDDIEAFKAAMKEIDLDSYLPSKDGSLLISAWILGQLLASSDMDNIEAEAYIAVVLDRHPNVDLPVVTGDNPLGAYEGSLYSGLLLYQKACANDPNHLDTLRRVNFIIDYLDHQA